MTTPTQPLSVLAVRPRIKAPPPIIIPKTSPHPTTVPKSFLPASAISPTRSVSPRGPGLISVNQSSTGTIIPRIPTIPVSPVISSSITNIRSNSQYSGNRQQQQINSGNSRSLNISTEGLLLPALPLPYEQVMVSSTSGEVCEVPSIGKEITLHSDESCAGPKIIIFLPKVDENEVVPVISQIYPKPSSTSNPSTRSNYVLGTNSQQIIKGSKRSYTNLTIPTVQNSPKQMPLIPMTQSQQYFNPQVIPTVSPMKTSTVSPLTSLSRRESYPTVGGSQVPFLIGQSRPVSPRQSPLSTLMVPLKASPSQ